MTFKSHLELKDRHAFLSASKYHWIRYTPEKVVESYAKHMDAALGTRLHAFAKEAILLGREQPATNQTLNLYVNDCIGYRMTPEQPLAYSELCFGTADAISFDEETRILRIFDLKNGVSPASEDQLYIYAALFCLEYKREYDVRPMELTYDLRIYQHDTINFVDPVPEYVVQVMSVIEEFDKLLRVTPPPTLFR